MKECYICIKWVVAIGFDKTLSCNEKTGLGLKKKKINEAMWFMMR